MPVSYRRLRSGDEGVYRHVHLESLRVFPDNFGTRFEEQRKNPKLQFERFIETSSKDNFVFGAFDGDELTGIAGFRRGDRPKTKHRGEIVQIYVDPSFQGQKIGETLVLEVIEAAFALPGVESFELSLVATNSSARKLYEKLGFETYGIHSRISNQARNTGTSDSCSFLRNDIYACVS